MATRYIYKDKKFTSLWQLRQEIWNTEQIVFGDASTQEEFAKYGLDVKFEEYNPIDELSIDTLRARCLQALERDFDTYRSSKRTFVTSSLGFKANANSTAYMDVDGLIGQAEALVASKGTSATVTFMDFDNLPHDLTIDQLKLLKNEIAANGSRAYGVKWQYRTQIEQAKDREVLNQLSQKQFDFSELAAA